MAISNTTIVFQNYSPKISKYKAFLVPNSDFLILHKFWRSNISRRVIKNDNTLLKFHSKKAQIRHIQGFLFLYETLHFARFKGVDFKYANVFSHFYLKIPKQSKFSPKFLRKLPHFGTKF